jgi:hypothetical protein
MVEASEIEHKFGCCSVLNHRIMWLYRGDVSIDRYGEFPNERKLVKPHYITTDSPSNKGDRFEELVKSVLLEQDAAHHENTAGGR